ncbi:MAG: hypothetical protein NT090_15020 [Acidobacteria bacterium]|nr:hypothetical protein [Acidobacteriota bacterium]
MQRWEYLIVGKAGYAPDQNWFENEQRTPHNDSDWQMLNRKGQEGWELVWVDAEIGFFLKRPISTL